MDEPEDPGGAGDPLGRVTITDEQSVPADISRLERTATHALSLLGISAELSVALVSLERVKDLKARFYGEDRSTDVLSFPMDGPGGPTLGDVVICPAYARRQARALGRSLDDELAQLLVHGILHLGGLDHATPREELEMAEQERRIVRTARHG